MRRIIISAVLIMASSMLLFGEPAVSGEVPPAPDFRTITVTMESAGGEIVSTVTEENPPSSPITFTSPVTVEVALPETDDENLVQEEVVLREELDVSIEIENAGEEAVPDTPSVPEFRPVVVTLSEHVADETVAEAAVSEPSDESVQLQPIAISITLPETTNEITIPDPVVIEKGTAPEGPVPVVITNTEVDHSAYINGILARAFGAAAVVLACVAFVVIVNLLKDLRNERKKAETAAETESTVSSPYDDDEYREMLDAIKMKLDTLRAEREVSDERVMAEIRKIFDNQLETLRNEIRCNADFQKEAEKAMRELDSLLGSDNGKVEV